MHADPAVAAAAQALASLDDLPISQTILRQAEVATEAASCGVSDCRLLRHNEGEHDWQLRQAVQDREQLASALGALLEVHGHPSDAFVQAVTNILHEHGRSIDLREDDDARSGSH